MHNFFLLDCLSSMAVPVSIATFADSTYVLLIIKKKIHEIIRIIERKEEEGS